MLAILAACFCACGIWATISLKQARRARLTTLQADFASGFGVAKALREGKANEALARFEAHAYASGVQLLGMPGPRSRVLDALAADLRAYRSNYARDTSSWSVVETRLEELLAMPAGPP